MPVGEFNVFYNQRQLISGVEGHRDHVYLSAIGFPERYEGLAFVTLYNEPVVGLLRYRDYVMVICPDSTYKLQGFTEDDYVMSVLEPDIGGLGHHGNKVGAGRAFIPGRKGVMIFNGAHHFGIPTRKTEWSALYNRSTRAWESALGVVNPNDETYQFLPYASALNALDYPSLVYSQIPTIFVGSYNTIGAENSGDISTPEWTNDTYGTPQISEPDLSRAYTTYHAYITPSGNRVGSLYRGDAAGRIFRELNAAAENVLAYEGSSIIALGHNLFGKFGGDRHEGKRMVRAWTYAVSELSQFTFYIWAGDEYALPVGYYSIWRQPVFSSSPVSTAPGYVEVIPQSYLEAEIQFNFTAVPARFGKVTVHPHVMSKYPTGRGFTFQWTFLNPNNITFIGLGGVWEPGVATRPPWIIGTGGG
jgi:hypothetical protein